MSHFLHRGQKRINLQRTPLVEILQHRGAVRTYTGGAVDAPLHVDAEIGAEMLTDLLRLEHHVLRNRARAGIGRDDVERGVGERGQRVKAEVAPQLDPDVVADVVIQAWLQPARGERVGELGQALARLTIRFAETELIAVDVLDDARLRDLGRRIDGGADDALGTDRIPLAVVGIWITPLP